jgi:hypothetical protein
MKTYRVYLQVEFYDDDTNVYYDYDPDCIAKFDNEEDMESYCATIVKMHAISEREK